MTANGSKDDAHDAPGGTGAGQAAWADAPRPSVQVVERVADARDRDPMDLPQLNDYVDPDALDKFLGAVAERGAGTAHVTFDYDGLRVTVDSTGAVTIEE